MESFNKYLKQFPHYSPDTFEKAKPYLTEVELDTGDHLLQLGKVCRNIAFIEKGLFRLYYLNDGKENVLCFCRENSITTSYESLISKSESEIAIQALEPTKVIVLSYDSLQLLYAKDLFWQQVGRLAIENEFINFGNHNRMVSDLSASDRYLNILETDNELLQRVPLNHLASYLQITPETLSRIRKKISRT